MIPRRSRSFIQHVNKFAADRSGAVALMFGIFGTVLLSLTAGGIEMHRRNAAIQELQNAADAAALAGKLEQAKQQSAVGTNTSRALGVIAAQRMFTQTMANSKLVETAGMQPAYTWGTDGSLGVVVRPSYRSAFGNVMPQSFTQLNVRASANASTGTPTEFALVLDTTMSMFNKDGRADTRFTLMRNAAKRFTHDLFNAAQAAGDVNLIRVSVVPWATSVNVRGAPPAAPSYAGATAVVSIPDWGSRLAVGFPIDRTSTVWNTSPADFAPVTWRGCIRGERSEAPNTYSDAAVANWDALLIKPAQIVMSVINEGPMTTGTGSNCTCTSTISVPCTAPPPGGTQGFNQLIERAIPQLRNARFTIGGDLQRGGDAETQNAQCTTCAATSCVTVPMNYPDCTNPTRSVTLRMCNYYGNGINGRVNAYVKQTYACTNEYSGCYPQGTNYTENQTRIACLADPNEPAVISNAVGYCATYGGPTLPAWDSAKPIAGPNMNCPTPMLGLSGNRSQVIEYLDRMTPVPGGTHADVGLRWGLRTLSANNNWPAFFGMATPPAAWNGGAQKAMVLITDGENEQAQDFAGYWGCSMNDADHDCITSPTGTELDTRMQGWCNAIRNTYNITLYVVAVNFTNAAAVSRLQTCAGNPANVFNVDASQLNTVMSSISARVMAMKLVQ